MLFESIFNLLAQCFKKQYMRNDTLKRDQRWQSYPQGLVGNGFIGMLELV